MEQTLLFDIVIVFAIALVTGLVCNRFRIPPLVAFLATGVIAGPYALSLIQSTEQVNTIAEIGIILLLFTIGLEFSFKSLWQIRRIAIFGGVLQVALTFGLFYAISLSFGIPVPEAIVIGFLVALSSTAIVLKLLHERGEVDSPHGGIILGILIFQDIVAIPMMMLVPVLATLQGITTGSTGLSEPVLVILGKDFALVIILIISAKWLIPWFLHQIARTRNRELFLAFIIMVCFGVGWMVSLAGLSLALGALLAGLLIAESEYSHQAVSMVLPFRDIFTSFFFVSVGMLLDIGFVIAHAPLIAFAVISVIIGKSLIASLAAFVLGYPARTVTLAGLSLAQIGEFSFIIAGSAFLVGLLPNDDYQGFLAVALITMAATPFIINAAPALAGKLGRIPFPPGNAGAGIPDGCRKEEMADHLIIVGYGVTGKNLAHAARIGGIPYVILELNPDTVREERAKGEPICFGDATADGVISHAGIERARIVVIAINDPVAVRKITGLCRHMNPGASIIVRTRYVSEVAALRELGADEVIAEEFETSIEIFTLVLNKFLVPRQQIDEFIDDVRSSAYAMLRTPPRTSGTLSDLTRHIPNVRIISFRIAPYAFLAGKTLGEVNLRKQQGILVLAIQRGENMITSIGGETRMEAGDVAVIYGTYEKIAASAKLFEGDHLP
ncbi:MAG: cation:proton antiporter [Methanoregulaceae archaeon]